MRKLSTVVITGLLLLGSGCTEFPLEGRGDLSNRSDVNPDMAIVVTTVPGDSESTSTICQAFERHLDRLETEAASTLAPDLEARAAALETVISDLCH